MGLEFVLELGAETTKAKNEKTNFLSFFLKNDIKSSL